MSLISVVIYSSPGGYIGRTYKTSTMGCAGSGCHTAVSTVLVSYFWSPDTVQLGQTVYDTLSVYDAENGTKMGIDIAARYGKLDTAGNQTNMKKMGDELTQTSGWSSNPAKWKFKYTSNVKAELTAPEDFGTNLPLTLLIDWNSVNQTADTLFATVCSKRANWNWTPSKRVINLAAVSYGVQISTNDNFTAIVFDTAGLTNTQINVPAGKLSLNTLYFWRVKAYSAAGTFTYSVIRNFMTTATSSTGNENLYIKEYKFYTNYPNPFNPSTTIKFDIPQTTNVKLEIFDMLGNKIQTLSNENYKAGTYSFDFNAAGLASGIYFCRIEAGDFSAVQKMTLIK